MSKIGALSADRLCRSTLGGCSICTDHCTGIHQRIRFRAFVTDTERQATSQARALEKFGPSVFPAGALAVGDMTEESQPLLRPKARYFQRISFAALSARKPLQQILSEEKDGSQQNAGLKRSISLIELIAFGAYHLGFTNWFSLFFFFVSPFFSFFLCSRPMKSCLIKTKIGG